MHTDIPYRELGRTGERVSAIGIGGWHLALAHVDRTLAVRIVRTALDRGINFLDNCWDYKGRQRKAHGSGASQRLPSEGVPDDED